MNLCGLFDLDLMRLHILALGATRSEVVSTSPAATSRSQVLPSLSIKRWQGLGAHRVRPLGAA